MTTEDPHRGRMAQARDRSAHLKEELRARRGGSPEPGDLYVLRATANLPVEWALLERGAGGKLLAVPADSGPPAGTADVEIPADDPGGPLSLRCGFSVWLDAALFEPELRSGVLAQESVTEARHRVRQIEAGTLEGSPLAEEVDVGPEYQDWSREVCERARELASAARPAAKMDSSYSSWGGAHRLAAALAVLAIGLSLWVASLRQEVNLLSTPEFGVPSEEVLLGSSSRGDRILKVPRDARQVLLVLVVDASVEEHEGRFEILDRQGNVIWFKSGVALPPAGEFKLTVPRRLLVDGDYRIRLSTVAGDRTLALEALRVETLEGP